MRQEQILFEKNLRTVNMHLKFVGIFIDSRDINKSTIEILRNHWFFCVCFITFNIDVIGEIFYLIQGILNGMSFVDVTYILPCLSLVTIGNVKSLLFIRYASEINEIVGILRGLLKKRQTSEDVMELKDKKLPFLHRISSCYLISGSIGIAAFALGPLVILANSYLTSGELKMVLPFLVSYPFNVYDIRVWPFMYLKQLWTACIAVSTVYGPDTFYYLCCTFIHMQFRAIQHDIETIVTRNSDNDSLHHLDLRREFVDFVNRHMQLIRCVEMLEIINSKSTLANFICSSLLICGTAFNIMAIDNLVIMVPFTPFLIMGLIQIYFLCYYGDTIMKSSTEVSDAVYNCQWYRLSPAVSRDFFLVLTRAQKPCKLTAYGFADVNLRAFTKILSTAWSYFALLTTLYNGNGK